MRKTTSLTILALAAGVAAAAAYVTQRGASDVPRSGELVYPDLLERLDKTAEIVTDAGQERFTLRREANSWVMAEKAGYPANSEQINQLAVGAAGLKRVEPKTSNPDLYAKIGLAESNEANVKAVRFTMKDASGEALADFVLGDWRPSKSHPSVDEYYIRLADDPQAWLVEGKLPRQRGLLDWLDRQIVEIERARVREVRVVHPGGEVVAVRQPAGGSGEFELLDVPAGAKVKEQWRVNDIGRGMASLQLEDVVPAAEFSGAFGSGYTVTLETVDGLRVTMETAELDGDTYARLGAAFVEPPAAPGDAEPPSDEAEPPSGEAATGAEAAGSAAPPSPPDAGEAGAAVDADAGRAEAERLNARWSGWVYQLARFKAGYFAKRQAELVEVAGDASPPQSPASDPPTTGG